MELVLEELVLEELVLEVEEVEELG